MPGKRSYRKMTLPPLPCGCNPVAVELTSPRVKNPEYYGGRRSGVRLDNDGSRVCLKHGRRFIPSWKEQKIFRR
jgi:hypothetical protein